MSKYFRKSNLFGKQKIVSIPEEVGMDIVEALDVLVFSDKKKSALLYQPEHPNKVPTEKIELDRSENEKCFCKGKYAKLKLLQKQVPKKNDKKSSTTDSTIPPLLKLSPSSTVIRKVSKDFVSQLKNELGNAPSPSSKSLSTWFRSSTPSRSKNILFKETVTTGHIDGNAQKCDVTLTPQLITLVSNHFQNKTLHVIIDEVHLIQLDEFQTICTIFASNCQEQQPLSLENFAPGRMHKFMLVLNYLIHLSRPGRRLIYHYSWNFVLRRQKLPDIIAVYTVTLSIECQDKMENFRLEQNIDYKIDQLVEEDNEALEILETTNDSWSTAFWVIKLNSLYVYDKKEDDCPRQFWLLSTVKELVQLDSDEQEYLLELAFDAEIVIFKFNEQESLGSWQAMIEKAKDFNASNYYTGETVTEIKEVVLAHDTSTVLTFNMDKKSQIIKQGILLIENITDVIMKDLKPECTLVMQDQSSKKIWRLTFSTYTETLKFVSNFDRLWKKK